MHRILFFISVLSLVSCMPENVILIEEREERQFKLAKEFQIQGRHSDALITYLGLISYRQNSPESHLEVGYIYLNIMEDPIRSIYHFDRYLELKPESENSVQVNQLIESAKKEYLRQLPTNPFEPKIDRLDLLDIIKGLKSENNALKANYNNILNQLKEIEGLDFSLIDTSYFIDSVSDNSTIDTQEIKIQNQLNTSTPDAIRIYVVKRGDSLEKISMEMYGTTQRWSEIFDANLDKLNNPNALKIGLKLKIP